MTPLTELLGVSPGIAAVREKVSRLLRRQGGGRLPPILIQGETGTGKGLLARAIHRTGPRREAAFVDLNCAAIPETLLEAELFGFERGAFTDARQAKPGLFQLAHGGTIFLDEVALLPEALQGKLLKVIEEKVVRRLGSTRTEAVDVWVIAASSADLTSATRERRFREDLYHRLAVLTLTLPPLRERGQDILQLAEHFLGRACREYGLAARSLDADARAALVAYDWPGNIRELSNVMERVALLAEGAVVTRDMLALPAPRRAEARERPALKEELGSVEREHLVQALRETNWNLSRAAARLGIPRNTLRYRMEKHGLQPGASPAAATARPSREALGPPAPVVPDVPEYASIRWEPRRLTLLRAAVVGTSADRPLPTSRGLEVAADKVRAFGGRVEERSPTGLVAAFGLEPVEDAPRRAAHAAEAIQKAAARARTEGEPLAVKLAIHVGRFLVGHGSGIAEIDLDGKHGAWAILDELLARAEPDSVIASESAVPFLERRFDLAPVGTLSGTKGRAYRLVGHERPGFGRRIAAFVGRGHHLGVLQSHLALAMRGQEQVIGIVGEAGIGKSRLIAEFRQSLAGVPMTYREGACLSYGSAIPYVPLLAVLRQNCRITDSDTADTIIAKVRRSLKRVGMEPDEWAPYLLQLFGLKPGTERVAALTPEAVRLRTVETLRQMILRASRQYPIVFVVEDIHWIDKTSEEVFASLVADLAGTAVMWVSTYRPGYRPPWIDRSFATQIALPPLSPEDSLAMMRSVLKTEIPEPLARVILEKAEGNPFFLEELCRAVEEQADLRALPAVPDTIEEVLRARIDRLPDEPRSVLQTASVLGREFPSRLLAALWTGSGSLDAHLSLLAGLEFLYQRAAGDDPVFVFKHALTQEVASSSLPPDRRHALHASAGQALETFYAGRQEEVYDRLAYHYSRANQATKAIEYLSRFAEKVARSEAHEEAVRAWKEALQHVERLPAEARDRRHLELVLRLPYSLLPLGRIEEIYQILFQERERLERLQDPALASHYHFLLGRAYILSGHEQAVESGRRAIAEAERCGDDALRGKAYSVLALAAALGGRAAEGIADGRMAVALLEKTEEQSWLGDAYWALGLCCSQTGAFEAALAAEARALAIAEAVGDQRLEASAVWVTGIVQAAMGDREASLETCRRATEKARDALNIAITTGCLGFAHLEAGDAPGAISALEQSIPLLHQFGFRSFEAWFTAFLAEAHRLDGRLDRAHALAGQALGVATAANFRIGMGWAQQALGRIARARGDLDEARARLAEALDTFTAAHSRYESARTHVDLAAVASARGDGEAARTHLLEAHAGFTALGVPRHVTRVEQLAAESGLSLAPAAP